MWALRSRIQLLKLSSQHCPTQLLRCQRQLATGIVNRNHIDNADDKKLPIPATTNTDTSKPKGKFRSKKQHLLRVLRHRVAKHKKGPSAIEPFHRISTHGVKTEVITLDETIEDLDGTWTELVSSGKYERVYPETVVPVAKLAHGLERTLFKPGVHLLKNLRTNRHYFTPFLENITQPDDFDYEAVQPYRTSSEDKTLIEMAKKQNARYTGSTSSLSGILSHLYFKVSNQRPLNISNFSKGFADQPKSHTRGSRVPKSILLRWKDGVYAVDADKSFDTGDTILSHLGKSMEKVLTMEPSDYERYLKKNSSAVTEEERNAPEAFAYGRIGDLFLRSQLDCYHQNLPRRTFDLKTRATMPIRLDIPHYQDYYNYKLEQNHGIHYSFEREYYDMMRSAFLKYSFQVRIGHMDGIMVTYHNTNKVFGFQYISRAEMDSRLFGTSKMGDEAFKHCLNLMQTIFDKAITQHPKQTLRITFDASRPTVDDMRVYIEPISEEQENNMNDTADDDTSPTLKFADITIDDPIFDPISDQVTMYRLHTTSYLNGKKIEGPVSMNREIDTWDVYYKLEEEKTIPTDIIASQFRRVRFNQAVIFLPQSDESPKFLEPFKSERRIIRVEPDSQEGLDTTEGLDTAEGLDTKEGLNTQDGSKIHCSTTPTLKSTLSTDSQ